MLTAEPTRQVRHSFGFTLGEAARIRRDILSSHDTPACPRCTSGLDVIGSRGTDEVVWFTTCPDCRLSLVVHRRAGDLA